MMYGELVIMTDIHTTDLLGNTEMKEYDHLLDDDE